MVVLIDIRKRPSSLLGHLNRFLVNYQLTFHEIPTDSDGNHFSWRKIELIHKKCRTNDGHF